MPPIYINGQEVVKRYVGIQEVVSAYVGSQQVFSSSLDPAVIALFGAGDQGAMLDFSDTAVLYQDNTGLTPVTDYGQVIGKVSDKSGKNNNATQATSANRPIRRGMPRTLGADIVLTGDFSSDANWTKGTGWSIGSGVATKAAGTGSDLSQTLTLTAGASYMVFFNVTRSAGTVTPKFTGGTTVSGSAISASGSHYELFTAATGNNAIVFSGDASFSGTVDNVVISQVASFVNSGAWFDGVNDIIKTGNIDMSSSNKATIIFSGICEKGGGSRTPFEVGNFYSNVTGSVAGLYDTKPNGRLRGDTAQVLVSAPNTEGPATTIQMSHVGIFDVDISGATTTDEIKVWARGVIPTQTPSGAASGGGNMANGPITVGGAFNEMLYWLGSINRVFVINRALTTDEKLLAAAWVKQGMAYCAVLGDSTSAYNNSVVGLSVSPSTASLTGGMVVGAADTSYSGDKIADQKTKWTALAGKTALQAVFIQVGLNDVNTYAGVSKTSTQIIADLQDLIDTVNAAKPAGCKTYICGLTPAKEWLGVSTGQQAAAYQAWLDVNEAISGAGAHPITGVNARITGHVAALNDGSGNLIQAYDHNNDGVHPNAQGKFIIGQYWRAQLEADRLV